MKKNPKYSDKNLRYSQKKYTCKKRGMKFDLTLEQYKKLKSHSCLYCGSKINQGFRVMAIDRIDNSKGYEYYNCVPSCNSCNVKKGDRSIFQFLERHPEVKERLNNLGFDYGYIKFDYKSYFQEPQLQDIEFRIQWASTSHVLNDIQYKILELKYGINTNHIKEISSSAVAKILNTSAQNICQHVKIAIKELKRETSRQLLICKLKTEGRM